MKVRHWDREEEIEIPSLEIDENDEYVKVSSSQDFELLVTWMMGYESLKDWEVTTGLDHLEFIDVWWFTMHDRVYTREEQE